MRRNVKLGDDEREFTRADERHQLVRRGQGHADPAGEADRDRHSLGRGAALAPPHLVVERAGARAPTPDALPQPQEVTVTMPLPDLSQPRRDRDRHPGRQARGHAPAQRDGLAYRATQDYPRSERAAVEEPDVFHLRGTAMAMNDTRGYHPGLVDLASGQISREIFVNERHLRRGAGAHLRPRLAVVGHESQIPKPGDYLRVVDGRGVGDPVPRPGRRGSTSSSIPAAIAA